jgi:hypothetical protein
MKISSSVMRRRVILYMYQTTPCHISEDNLNSRRPEKPEYHVITHELDGRNSVIFLYVNMANAPLGLMFNFTWNYIPEIKDVGAWG